MSVTAMAWAWKQDVGGSDKLVLLALADHADDEGVCWPGKRGVAEKCGLARSTVIAVIKRLEQAGLLTRQERFRDDGSRDSDLIQLRWEPDGPVRGSDQGGPTPGPRTEPSLNMGEESPIPPLVERGSAAECFAYWQERCRHPTAKLTAERRRKIEARLREGYTVDDIRRAIDGAAKAAFVNDHGRRFDDIELICRSGSKLEGFMGRVSSSNVALMRSAAVERMDAWRNAPEYRGGDAG